MSVYDQLKAKKSDLEAQLAEKTPFRPEISENSRRRLRSASASRSRSTSRNPSRNPSRSQSRSNSLVDADSVRGSVVEDDEDAAMNAPGAVFRRLHEESKNLKSRLREKRKQIVQEMGETFAPKISERSRQIASQQRSQTRAGEQFLHVRPMSRRRGLGLGGGGK